MLSGCQEEDLAGISIQPEGKISTDKAPNPVPDLMSPSSVIKTEYLQAISWLATWKYAFWDNRQSLAGVFNFNSLNASGAVAIAQADMDVLFGRILSLEKYSSITYKDYAPKTRFIPSDLAYLASYMLSNSIQHYFRRNMRVMRMHLLAFSLTTTRQAEV